MNRPCVNPQGCQVFSFKHPSAAELQHDFLWRTTRDLPERGRIGIFDRSYYEEVLIVRVRCGSSTASSEMSSKLTVWYNTKCPVCNSGIEWQHRRLVRAARAGVIEFRDINLEPDVLSRFGAGAEDVRRRLHAVDAKGRLHVGADCAFAIWLRTPGDAWLRRVLSLRVIHPIARIGYDRFADLLYAWNCWQGRW